MYTQAEKARFSSSCSLVSIKSMEMTDIESAAKVNAFPNEA